MKGHTSKMRRNRGSATVGTAEKMGRDRLPLRLARFGRTLVLSKQHTGDGLVVSLETGRAASTTMRTYIDKPAQPEIVDGNLMFRGMWLQLAIDEREPIAAWLAGFYGGEA